MLIFARDTACANCPHELELDPAVYHAARTYLNLGQPHEVVLEDGLQVVTDRAHRLRNMSRDDVELSDLVIHDCFTGGSVPAELFTVDFWNDLALSMKPDGILVVVRAIESTPVPR